MISFIVGRGNSEIISQIFDYNVFDELLKLMHSEDEEILERVLKAMKYMLKKISLNPIRKKMISEKLVKFESVNKLQELCNHPIETIHENSYYILNFINIPNLF